MNSIRGPHALRFLAGYQNGKCWDTEGRRLGVGVRVLIFQPHHCSITRGLTVSLLGEAQCLSIDRPHSAVSPGVR